MTEQQFKKAKEIKEKIELLEANLDKIRNFISEKGPIVIAPQCSCTVLTMPEEVKSTIWNICIVEISKQKTKLEKEFKKV